MKTVKTILNKVMIVTVTVFFLGLAANTGSAKAETTEGTAAICGVSDADVVKYLSEHGYQVLNIKLVEGCCDRIAYTQNSYTTRVFIGDSRILGHEDVNGM